MKLVEHERAISLRKQGRSMKEIANTLFVAKSTVSLWVRDISLSRPARKRIRLLYTNGQIASQKANRAKTALKERHAQEEAKRILSKIPDNRELKQLLCCLIYWCEGAKRYGNMGNFSFTNSDPELISTFLSLLRESFELDEAKFRVCMHLHSYHDEKKQLKFWSKMTSIPTELFIRSYRKRESGISIRSGYQGCISIRYHDTAFLRQILAIASEFLKKRGP
ncbi:MAG: Uncharacterized protein G01um10148_491 [Parcubacteria group bacterium Gr01-1014_8]|nr:MAG: Uncharacterized protein G01um10148_491 [Parcubacteria group bacterium Gr01-1014_8]